MPSLSLAPPAFYSHSSSVGVLRGLIRLSTRREEKEREWSRNLSAFSRIPSRCLHGQPRPWDSRWLMGLLQGLLTTCPRTLFRSWLLATFWNFDVDATVGFAIIKLRIFIKKFKWVQMLEIFETCVKLYVTSDFITSENVNWIYSNYNYYRDIHFEFI